MVESRKSGSGSGEREPETAGRLAETLPPDSPSAASTYESGEGDDADELPGDDVDLLARGSAIGRYLVLERLGAGAMGVVYAAYDPELDRKIALKLLRPQTAKGDVARRQARMVREAKAIAKLSHPNVVAIFDVGVHEGQVFMAMEHLAGGTLSEWMAAKKRSWRDIVKMFVEVGKGLAGAHVEGLVHRDFKPDNVLLDKNGVPKVVDFGLVRLSAGAPELTDSGALRESSSRIEPQPATPPTFAAGTALTRTGALTGTPAYMAPEQFAGKPVDARTDQFAFCVALFEALYGERPFAGTNVIALADSVITGRIREAPKGAEVPAWLRRVVARGLATTPEARWPSMETLAGALADDPAIKRRRRSLITASVGLLLVGVLVARGLVVQRRNEIEKQVARQTEVGGREAQAARTNADEASNRRKRAFEAFDALQKDVGESLWRDSRARVPTADAAYERAEQALQTALMLDRSNEAVRVQLAGVTREHLLFAEQFHLDGKLSVLRERLANVDTDRRERDSLAVAAHVRLQFSPAASRIILERYEPDSDTGRLNPKLISTNQGSSLEVELAPGSYRVSVDAPASTPVVFPFEVSRGQTLTAALALPASGSIPLGFVYVPSGDFYLGDTDETVRAAFSSTVPAHRVHQKDFIIQSHEVTFGDWIRFIQTRRREQLPYVENSVGHVSLTRSGGRWTLNLRIAGSNTTAVDGEPIVFPGRGERSKQNWRQLPVMGISPLEIKQYATWLSTVLGTRLRMCTELEWERAARGADARAYPHGNVLSAVDANIDESYGRVPTAFGPDEVGSHPLSNSPFGLSDMAGNVFEMTVNLLGDGMFVGRGGAYYYDRKTASVANRQVIEPTFRFPGFGFRLCGDV